MTITVSTDGSALGNPNGPMGWAWADHPTTDTRGHEHRGDCDAGGATNGTNQIGELCAVLQALRAHPGSEDLLIETDSQYAINCSTKWIHGWKKNGWKNSKKEPVKNAALIKAIDAEIQHRAGSVKFRWVKGHAGNAGNEKVDELARTYAEDCRSSVRDGYLPREGWQSLLDSPYAKGTDIPQDAQMLLDGTLNERDYCAERCMGSDDDSPVHSSTQQQIDSHAVPEQESSVHESSPAADSAASAHSTPAQSSPEQSTSLAAKQSVQHNADSAQPRLHHSGLQVSGQLMFTPPPSSSPYYDGSDRRIRGYIEIEGIVHGDGTMSIDHAPFLIYTKEAQ